MGFNTQSEMGLAEVLQMCCISRRSGQIIFRSGESAGYVYIQQGRVLHAMCGTIEGEEAIYTMLTWPGGGFTLNEDILPHKKTVVATWEQLLFEGARRADEGTQGMPRTIAAPVTTIEPVISTRAHDSQPKLIVTRPDLDPVTYDLVQEYTHLGRTPGNEICLPYPSISSRHCIFIISGPDIVLRDLNSSNGTWINGESINEVVLRPGDVVNIGVCEIKFEAGMKRPKLRGHSPTIGSTEPLKATTADLTQVTVPIPMMKKTSSIAGTSSSKADLSYVKGQAAINYSDLAKPAPDKKPLPWLMIVMGLIVVLGGGGCVYFLFFRH